MTHADDVIKQWVLDARNGDQDAFAELVYTYQDAVYNLCYRMLGTPAEAEDATQEALIRAYTKLDRYDINRSFKTWLLSIASNHSIDRLRKRRTIEISIDDEPTAAVLALSSDEPQPEQAALHSERSQEMQELLDELAPDYRLAVVLRYWYDYSYAEIAKTMNTTESAIKSRLFRARQMLAEKLNNSSGDTGLTNPALEVN